MKENEMAPGRMEDTKDLACEQLLSGEAWEDFLSKLNVVGRRFLEKEFPRSPHMAALAYRHLLRLIRAATEVLLEYANPDRPVLVRTFDLGSAYAIDNPDFLYHNFLALPGMTYRLRGKPARKGKPPHFISVNGLVLETLGLPRLGAHVNNANGTLEVDSERGFDLVISANEHRGGDWLRLEPELPHQRIMIRQIFLDWNEERPLHLELERVEETGPGASLSAEAVALALELIVAFIEFQSEHWLRNTLEVRERGENVLANAMNLEIAGLPGQRYAQGFYKVPDGQALLVEFRPPNGYGYWGIQLANWFGESLDYAQRCVSINSHQAVVDQDGVFRAIIAVEDPGVPNWLDIGGGEGFSEGLVVLRFFMKCAEDWEIDVPRMRLLPFGLVRQAFPRDHPQVDVGQRRREMRTRRRHLMRRLGQ